MVLSLLMVGCMVPPDYAEAGSTLTGNPPWAIERVVLGSTTDWDVFTAAAWAAQAIVKNEHASGVLSVGRYDETGTYSAANDEYILLPAGASIVLPLTGGRQRGDAAHLAIPLYSATASLPVSIVLVETPE